MESLSVDELMRGIERDATGTAQPGCYYSKAGDCLFCHVEDVPYHARRVDGLLTLYLAEDDDRLVGAQIKGLRKLPRHDALALHLRREGEVQVLELLLLTYQSQDPSPGAVEGTEDERKARYFDVATRVRGLSIPAADLQLA